MKNENLKPELFVENRKRFISQLKPRGIAIFNSNDEMPKDADALHPYRQNNNLFYLTGIDQEDTILVLYPDADEEKYREILFLKETSELIAIWEGHKFTKKEATALSGIKSVEWLREFDTIFHILTNTSEYIYLETNEHLRAKIVVETRNARFVRSVKEKFPLHKYERIAPVMFKLRSVKSSYEIELIQHACNVTEGAFRRIMKKIKPGITELEIEADITHEFLLNRCTMAYSSIIASGKNACVLHYTQNDQICKNGDVILMDFGAEYCYYASDLTRTVPVNGKFTRRQKQVYRSVKHVLDEAAKMLTPGNTIEEYHKEVGKIMEQELIKLSLLSAKAVKRQKKDKPLYKRYFMHGTSHFLGLDVHDVGHKYKQMEIGMVFTCEPGIYIPKEGLGIRLENDFLITDKGQVNLMKNIPIEIEEIEDLMNTKN